MSEPSSNVSNKPWITVQAIIIGLVITKALGGVFSNLDAAFVGIPEFNNWPNPNWAQFFTYCLFSLLLVRFYWGAYRVSNKQENNNVIVTRILNFAGGIILFSAFYFMAESINDIEKFLLFVFLLHLVDLVWFVISLIISCITKNSSTQKIALYYIIFTILTLLGFLFTKSVTLIFVIILIISLLDFYILRKFYIGGSEEENFTPVILESRYRADTKEMIDRNKLYGRLCMHDCLSKNEAPYASHLLYTQPNVYDDSDAVERQRGIDAGFVWREKTHKTVIYEDFGLSDGIKSGIEDATKKGKEVVLRKLPQRVMDMYFEIDETDNDYKLKEGVVVDCF